MITPVFALKVVRVPFAFTLCRLERLASAVTQEIRHELDPETHQRMLRRMAFSCFMAGSPLLAQNFSPTAAPAQDWVSLAASADGTRLVAVGSYGYLYLSSDAGASWTRASTSADGTEPQRPWQAVASSSDGSKLAAVANFSPIFVSTNYGATWSTNGPAADWAAVASSADGKKLVAVDYDDGGIYVSSDSGLTWNRTSAPARRWRCVASSGDGARLVAGTDFGSQQGELPELYTSADAGATWQLTTAPNQPWQSIACSQDGQRLAAAVYGGGIFLSGDAGTNWAAAKVPALHWSSVCSSGHGDKLIAAASEGQIYSSTDAGATWSVSTAPDAPWQAMACSFDGSRAFAGIWNSWLDETAGIYSAEVLSPVSNPGQTGQSQSAQPNPGLGIRIVGGLTVVSWPGALTNVQLQESSDLDSAAWTDVVASPSAGNGRNEVTIPSAPGNHFFRLVLR